MSSSGDDILDRCSAVFEAKQFMSLSRSPVEGEREEELFSSTIMNVILSAEKVSSSTFKQCRRFTNHLNSTKWQRD